MTEERSHWVRRVGDGLCRVTWGALYLDLVVLVVVMFAGVIARFVLNHALSWGEELATFLTLFLVFIGSAQALRDGQHPAITLLGGRLGSRGRALMRSAAAAVIGGYLLAAVYYGVALVQTSAIQFSTALGIRMSWPLATLPLGAALAFWQLLSQEAEGPTPGRRVLWTTLISGLVFLVIWVCDHQGLGWLTALWVLLPALFAAEVPIGFAIGTFSMVLISLSQGAPLIVAAQRLVAGVDDPALLAIPVFMLTGTLLGCTGMAGYLIDFATSLVGHLRGGLALADVLASVVFADTSGSAVADTAALGSVMIPGMIRQGYDAAFSAAHQAAAGSLGTLFPPSISMIIFATVTSTSVARLFAGSILPGLAVVLAYIGTAYLFALRRNFPREPRATSSQILATFWRAAPTLFAPVIVLGGILGGVFTPTEAGAIATVYVFLIGAVLYRRAGLSDYARAARESIHKTAMVMFIIANTTIFSWALLTAGLPQQVAAFVTGLSSNPKVALLPIAAFLLLLSIFLEPPAILIGAIPLLLPAIQKMAISPIEFGVVTMLASAAGMLLPPIGITLLVATSISSARIDRSAYCALPYVLACLAVLVLVIVFPGGSLWLARH